jgi:hypothetical protein
VNIKDLSFLADHVSTIDGRRPERLDEVQARIRTARRRRATGAVGGAAALAAAVVAIAAVVPGMNERSGGPVDEPPLPTVSSPVDEPEGQTAIPADFGPQDVVHGNVLIGSATSKPGDTQLSANLPYFDTPYAVVVGYCRGGEDIWWVANGTYGQCSPDAALEPTPPEEFQPIGNAPSPLPEAASDQEFFAVMYLTAPLSAKARHCIENSPDPDLTADCLDSNDVTLLKHADAAFGFTAYVHSAPDSVLGPVPVGFEALANLDGTDYLFTRGVASAPGADRLAAYLDVSEHPRLLMLAVKGKGIGGFGSAELLVDGQPAQFPEIAPGSPWRWGFGELAARAVVPPGSHNVTVDLPAGARAELLVYEAGIQP